MNKESSISYATGCDVQVNFIGKVKKEHEDGTYDIICNDGNIIQNIHKINIKLVDNKVVKSNITVEEEEEVAKKIEKVKKVKADIKTETDDTEESADIYPENTKVIILVHMFILIYTFIYLICDANIPNLSSSALKSWHRLISITKK